MAVFKWTTKQKLRIWEPKKVAPSLHKDMYTAFAEWEAWIRSQCLLRLIWKTSGDLDSLRLLCGDGLLNSFQKRIAARRHTQMKWKLHKLLSRPKVVSNKAHHYMGYDQDRRQAIVRIHSLQVLPHAHTPRQHEVEYWACIQSLSKFDAQGKHLKGEPKEVVEYLVIEKNYHMGKESPWYVWGTTEETTSTYLPPPLLCVPVYWFFWQVQRFIEENRKKEARTKHAYQ